MVESLFLVKNGIPWDVAINLDDDERLAYFVIFGTLDGGQFNWETCRWERRE